METETIDLKEILRVDDFLHPVQYSFLNLSYALYVANNKIIDYIDRFMKAYKVNKKEETTTPFINIYATAKIDLTKYYKLVEQEIPFTMHIGKGERWNMKAKSIQTGNWRIVHLLNTGTVFLLNSTEKIGCVLGKTESNLTEDVFHLIRSLMCRGGELNQYSIFHAAGTIIDNKGVMIVGESGHGKTTTFLEFIKQGSIPVSNDRVFISSNSKSLIMYEWPSFINTSIGTIHKYKELENYKENFTFNSIEELWNSKIKFPIEPPDFCHLFNVEYQSSHPIDVLIFPELSHNTEGSYIQKIEKDEAKKLLRESCYTPNDPAYLDWHHFIQLDSDRLQEQSSNIIYRLIDEIPCFVLKGGVSLSKAMEEIQEQLII